MVFEGYVQKITPGFFGNKTEDLYVKITDALYIFKNSLEEKPLEIIPFEDFDIDLENNIDQVRILFDNNTTCYLRLLASNAKILAIKKHFFEHTTIKWLFENAKEGYLITMKDKFRFMFYREKRHVFTTLDNVGTNLIFQAACHPSRSYEMTDYLLGEMFNIFNLDEVKELINIKEPNKGETIAHSMFQKETDNFETFLLLFKHGMKINVPDKEGKTPLFVAMSNNKLKEIKFLVDELAGKDIKHVCDMGYTAIDEGLSNSKRFYEAIYVFISNSRIKLDFTNPIFKKFLTRFYKISKKDDSNDPFLQKVKSLLPSK